MFPYIITLLVYLLSGFLVYQVTGSLIYALLTKLILVGLTLIYFRKSFSFKLRWDNLAVLTGIIISLIWFFLDPFYPHIHTSNLIAYTTTAILLKMIIGVIYAPIIEEFFTRFFLLRWIISKKWKKVPLGKYTHLSFILTVLFFGVSHNMWLTGLITGVLLNLLYYKNKNIESCILAHAVANLLLGVLIISTNSWHFW